MASKIIIFYRVDSKNPSSAENWTLANMLSLEPFKLRLFLFAVAFCFLPPPKKISLSYGTRMFFIKGNQSLRAQAKKKKHQKQQLQDTGFHSTSFTTTLLNKFFLRCQVF